MPYRAELLAEYNDDGTVAGLVNRNTGATVSPVSGDEVATWADLPAASSVTVGRTYTVLADGSRWRSDGSWWRPANGSVVIAGRVGSRALPIATLTGVTSGAFVLPTSVAIRPGMIAPHSRVRVEVDVRRLTNVATMQVAVWLGTTGTTADALVTFPTIPATTNQDVWIFTSAAFSDSRSVFTTLGSSPVNSHATASGSDQAANVNADVLMYATIGIRNANVADTAALISYRVSIEAMV